MKSGVTAKEMRLEKKMNMQWFDTPYGSFDPQGASLLWNNGAYMLYRFL